MEEVVDDTLNKSLLSKCNAGEDKDPSVGVIESNNGNSIVAGQYTLEFVLEKGGNAVKETRLCEWMWSDHSIGNAIRSHVTL